MLSLPRVHQSFLARMGKDGRVVIPKLILLAQK